MRAKTKVMEKQKKDGDTGNRINRKNIIRYFNNNIFIIISIEKISLFYCQLLLDFLNRESSTRSNFRMQ